jgi:ubiquinone/menaquinone biosynthesis C-methylase UbiE
VFGRVAQSLTRPLFPAEALFGDVVRGLPVATVSTDRVYCQHVLEHLALVDFRKALTDVLRVLKPGGVFRGVLPDLEHEVRTYLANPAQDACSTLMQETYLGITNRPKGLSGFVRALIGNSHHLWMWDYKGIRAELEAAGFENIRRAAC